MKNILIAFVLVTTFSAGILYLFQKEKTEPQIPQTDVEEKNEISLPPLCAKEGENIGSCFGCMAECCENLKALPALKYDGVCVDIPAPGSGSTCSDCGNGICDSQNKEDECNCPEDCQS